MTSLVEAAALLLAPAEREAVLGDLAEAGESVWRGLLGVFGLVIRREAILWKSWRPWLAAFGLSMPASFCLMGYSLTVSGSFQSWLAGGRATPVLMYAAMLLAWSWAGGFVVASLSRRTLWMSILATCSPCLFCLARFRESSLPRICLLLFLRLLFGEPGTVPGGRRSYEDKLSFGCVRRHNIGFRREPYRGSRNHVRKIRG